jgi:hypothetical protein
LKTRQLPRAASATAIRVYAPSDVNSTALEPISRFCSQRSMNYTSMRVRALSGTVATHESDKGKSIQRRERPHSAEQAKGESLRRPRPAIAASEELTQAVSAALGVVVSPQPVSEGEVQHIASQLANLKELGIDENTLLELANDAKVIAALHAPMQGDLPLSRGRGRRLADQPPMGLLKALASRGNTFNPAIETLLKACPRSKRLEFAQDILKAGTLPQLLHKQCKASFERLVKQAFVAADVIAAAAGEQGGADPRAELNRLCEHNFPESQWWRRAGEQPQLPQMGILANLEAQRIQHSEIDSSLRDAKGKGLVETGGAGTQPVYSFDFKARPMEGFPLTEVTTALRTMHPSDPRAESLMALVATACADKNWKVTEAAARELMSCLHSISRAAAGAGATGLQFHADKSLAYLGDARGREIKQAIGEAPEGGQEPLLQAALDMAHEAMACGAPQLAARLLHKLSRELEVHKALPFGKLLNELHAAAGVIVQGDYASVQMIDELLTSARRRGLVVPDPMTNYGIQAATQSIVMKALERGNIHLAQRTCRQALAHVSNRAGTPDDLNRQGRAVLLGIYEAVSLAKLSPEQRKEAFESLRSYWTKMRGEKGGGDWPAFEKPIESAMESLREILSGPKIELLSEHAIDKVVKWTPSQIVSTVECAKYLHEKTQDAKYAITPKEYARFCQAAVMTDESLAPRFDDETRKAAAQDLAQRIDKKENLPDGYSAKKACRLCVQIWPLKSKGSHIPLLRNSSPSVERDLLHYNPELLREFHSDARNGLARSTFKWNGILEDLPIPESFPERIAHALALSERGFRLVHHHRGKPAAAAEMGRIAAHVELLELLIDLESSSAEAVDHLKVLEEAGIRWKADVKSFKFNLGNYYRSDENPYFLAAKKAEMESVRHSQTLAASAAARDVMMDKVLLRPKSSE